MTRAAMTRAAMTRAAITLSVVALSLAASSCTSTPDTPKADKVDVSDGGPTDTGHLLLDSETYDTADVDPTPKDAGDDVADVAACPGGFGCLCMANDECDSSYCGETATGRRCGKGCVEDCPAGFLCSAAATSDSSSMCVDAAPRLCSPCEDNSQCHSTGVTDARCIPSANGAFCGVACKADGDCPAGHACKATVDVDKANTQQCVPVDKKGQLTACRCSPNAVALTFKTPCTTALLVDGKTLTCSGWAQCKNAGDPALCTAPTPTDESCDGVDNDCDGETDEQGCDDKNPCTADVCDAAKGCVHTAGGDGAACDADGSVCTVADSCVAGLCKAGAIKVCDDKNPCTLNSCDPEKGCVKTDDDNKPCDDGNGCSVGDTCTGGACVPGLPKACTSTNTCVTTSCDAKSGACETSHKPKGTACSDASPCTVQDGCDAGGCVGVNKSCDDNNPCTDDSCDPKKSGDPCVHLANAASCTDGDACTLGDKCKGAACGAGAAKSCDDNEPCTADACAPKTGACGHDGGAKAGASCDDGDACTSDDACKGGSCSQHAPTDCDDKVTCTKDSCDKVKGCQHQTTDSLCDDGVACTTDACDASKGCQFTPVAAKCDDGHSCSIDSCDAKAKGTGCVHTYQHAKCDDGNGCTDDACTAKGCAKTPNSSACQDGNKCTGAQGDTCKGGACIAGAAVDCDDKNPCTDDSCGASVGCLHGATKADTACDDGEACTQQTTCTEKVCGGGKPALWEAKLGAGVAGGVVRSAKGTWFVTTSVTTKQGGLATSVRCLDSAGKATGQVLLAKSGLRDELRGGVGLPDGSVVYVGTYGEARPAASPWSGALWSVRVKADCSGTVWARTDAGVAGGYHQGHAVAWDGAKLVVAGGLSASKSGVGAMRAALLRLDAANGKVLDTTMLGPKAVGVLGAATALQLAPADAGGGVFVVGNEHVAAGDAFVAHVHANGKLKWWQRAPDSAASERLWGLALAPKGGFVAVGSAEKGGAGGSDVWLVHYTATGTLVWQRLLGGLGSEVGRAVMARAGGYLIAGEVAEKAFGSRDVQLLGVSGSGQRVWQQTFTVPGDDQAKALHAADGPGFVIAGAQVGAWVARRDPFGSTTCHEGCMASQGCDDGKACTQDTCDGKTGKCAHTLSVTPLSCDDGDACTVADTCTGAACKGKPKLWSFDSNGTKSSDGNAAVALPDGGIIVVGDTASADGFDGILLRANAGGELSKPVVFNVKGQDTPTGLVRLVSGDLGVVGHSKDGAPYQAWARRVELDGTLVWSKSFGGAYDDMLLDVVPTATGGMVAAGMTHGSHASHKHGWLLQLDAKGKAIGELEIEAYDTTLYGLTQTPGAETYVACGVTQLGKATWDGGPRHGGQDGWLAGLDIAGKKILWQTFHGGTRSDHLNSIAPVAGGYIAVGATSSGAASGYDHFVVRTNTTGKALWTRTIGWAGHENSVAVVVQGDALFLAGSTQSQGWGGDGDAIVMSLGLAKGETRWTRVRGTTGSDRASALVAIAPDTLAWVGRFGSGTGTKTRVERFDLQGNFTCGSGCAKAAPCDDGNDCTFDQCSPKTGKCVSTPAYDGMVCVDGQPCSLDGACSQGSCAGAGKRTFHAVHGAVNDNELFYAAAGLADGGVLLAGARQPGGKGAANGWLRNVDVNGKVVWKSEFPADQTGGGGISAIVQSSQRPDRAVAVAHAEGAKIRMVKVNLGTTGGQIIDPRVVAPSTPGFSFTSAGLNAIAALPATSQYAVAGSANVKTGGSRGWFLYTFEGSNNNSHATFGEAGTSVAFNGVASIGGTSSVAVGVSVAAGVSRGLVVRWERYAKPNWAKTFPKFNDISEAVLDPDGGILVVGEAPKSATTGRDLMVGRVFQTGKMDWTARIARPGDQTPYGVAMDGAGHLVITGWTQATGKKDVLFARLALGGSGVAAATVRSLDFGATEEGIALTRSRDDYWIAGLRNSSGLNDGLLVRVDHWGNATCHVACVKQGACTDGKACTADTCDGGTGKCSHTATACGGGAL